ncbi:MAG: RNA 2',3'-cyclic phosphodiesterase [Chloroflexi bacterium]|nr:RNA 2',3'-cyclic phosphodiesterase [Chloroflexota bacterium]
MPQQIRTFIAIELNEALHRELGDLEADLKGERWGRQVRWVSPESIHLTVKFLGSVESNRLGALQQAVVDACATYSPFSLTLSGLGAFPNTRRPNVIWVGIIGETQVAAEISERIEVACQNVGFPREERPFSPHLTLGRIRRETRPSERTSIGETISARQVGDLGGLRVENVSIMKSDLTPSGSIYTRLAEVKLGHG